MSSLSRRSLSFAPWFLLFAFVAMGGLQLQQARSVTLAGFVFDGALEVLPESRIPAGAPIAPGDRLVSVAGQPVSAPAELAAVLARTRGDQVLVRFREAPQTRIVLAGPELTRMLADRPQGERIRLHRVSGGTGVMERTVGELVGEMGSLAQAGVYGEVRVPGRSTEGHVPVQRGGAGLASVLLLLVGFIGLVAIFLLRAESLEAGERQRSVPLWAATIGGLALASVGILAVEPGLTGRWVLHAACLVLLWRAISLLLHLEWWGVVDTLGRRLLVVGPAAGVAGLVWAGLWFVSWGPLTEADGPGGAVAIVLGLALALHLVDVAVHFARWSAGGRAVAVLSGVATVPLLGVLAWGGIALPELMWGGITGSVLVLWSGDLWMSARVPRPGGMPAAAPGAGGVAQAILEAAEQAAPGSRVWWAVGSGAGFLRATLLPPLDGRRLARVERAPERWDAALTMLVAEGVSVPGPPGVDDDEDPFGGLARHTGIVAATPVDPGSDRLIAMVLVLERDDEQVPSQEALGRLRARLEDVSADLLELELATLAQGAGLLASAPSPPSTSVVVRAASAARSLVPEVRTPTRELTAWVQALERTTAWSWPVSEEGVLDDREWAALQPYVDDAGPTLLIGEAGGGKEFMARAIFHRSHGESDRFLAVDAALVPASILDVLLFGDDEAPGLIEGVAGGALLIKTAQGLDGSLVKRLAGAAQAAGTRLFFAFRYAGPEEEVDAHLPAVFAELCAGRRLSISPLRERPADIRRYADLFLHRYAMQYDRVIEGLDDSVAKRLAELELPANFLDLQALIRAAVLRSEGESLGVDDVDPGWTEEGPDVALEPAEREERDALLAALAETDGNKSEAARLLGVSRGRLLRRLKKFGVTD